MKQRNDDVGRDAENSHERRHRNQRRRLTTRERGSSPGPTDVHTNPHRKKPPLPSTDERQDKTKAVKRTEVGKQKNEEDLKVGLENNPTEQRHRHRRRRSPVPLLPRDSVSVASASNETVTVLPGAQHVIPDHQPNPSMTASTPTIDGLSHAVRRNTRGRTSEVAATTMMREEEKDEEEMDAMSRQTPILQAEPVPDTDAYHNLRQNYLQVRQELDELRQQRPQTTLATVIINNGSMVAPPREAGSVLRMEEGSGGGNYNTTNDKKEPGVLISSRHVKWYIICAAVVILVLVGIVIFLLSNNGTGSIPTRAPVFPPSIPQTTTPTVVPTQVPTTPPTTIEPVPTNVASNPPTPAENWFQILVDILNIENLDSLPDNSPELRSLEWMSFQDPLRNDLIMAATAGGDSNINLNRIILERYVIVMFYFATNGLLWNNQFDFLSGTSVCSWNNGIPFGQPGAAGIYCNGQGYIIRILLHINGLQGTVPSQLGEITSLFDLWIYANRLSSTIPESLVSLTNLNTFYIGINEFTGTFSESFSSWRQLTAIDMSSTQLGGTMPHSISSWTNLQRFLIQNNQFTGTFPNSIVSSWTILGTFRISSNQFTGTIPSALGSLSFISEIWVHDNDLTGNIDALFCSTSPTSVSIQADCGGTNPKIVCTCCTTCH